MKKVDPKIEFCMDLAVAELVHILQKENPSLTHEHILADFSKTKTYEKIYNPGTRLWAEGPIYLLDFYEEHG